MMPSAVIIIHIPYFLQKNTVLEYNTYTQILPKPHPLRQFKITFTQSSILMNSPYFENTCTFFLLKTDAETLFAAPMRSYAQL